MDKGAVAHSLNIHLPDQLPYNKLQHHTKIMTAKVNSVFSAMPIDFQWQDLDGEGVY